MSIDKVEPKSPEFVRAQPQPPKREAEKPQEKVEEKKEERSAQDNSRTVDVEA